MAVRNDGLRRGGVKNMRMRTNATVALLLEDEPLISMDLELTFGNAGFDVYTVMSSEEAFKSLGMLRPDFAIVDIELRDGPCHKVAAHLVDKGDPLCRPQR